MTTNTTPEHPENDADTTATTPQAATPAAGPADSATPATAATTTTTSTEPVEPRRSRRPLVLGLGIGAAALGLVALTAGITAAVVDEDDDDDRAPAGDSRPFDESPRNDADDRGPGGPGAGPEGRPGQAGDVEATASAADFAEARDAALEAADGQLITDIEVNDRGWSVDVLLPDGDDVEVRLADDFSVLDVETPDGETDRDAAPAGSLAGGDLDRVIEAALAEVDGEVHSVSLTDDDGAAYDVTVVAEDGTENDLDLDADLAVLAVDADRRR